jgi:hypothetical protein
MCWTCWRKSAPRSGSKPATYAIHVMDRLLASAGEIANRSENNFVRQQKKGRTFARMKDVSFGIPHRAEKACEIRPENKSVPQRRNGLTLARMKDCTVANSRIRNPGGAAAPLNFLRANAQIHDFDCWWCDLPTTSGALGNGSGPLARFFKTEYAERRAISGKKIVVAGLVPAAHARSAHRGHGWPVRGRPRRQGRGVCDSVKTTTPNVVPFACPATTVFSGLARRGKGCVPR